MNTHCLRSCHNGSLAIVQKVRHLIGDLGAMFQRQTPIINSVFRQVR